MQTLNRIRSTPKFVTSQSRFFQTFGGPYKSGFDRMLWDKLKFAQGRLNGGTLFALMGFGNIAGYLMGKMMDK